MKRNPRTAWREYDGVTLVITPDDSMIHKLNETGTALWNLLRDDGLATGEMVERLAERYGGSLDEMDRDVRQFVEQALRKGLLVDEGAGHGD